MNTAAEKKYGLHEPHHVKAAFNPHLEKTYQRQDAQLKKFEKFITNERPELMELNAEGRPKFTELSQSNFHRLVLIPFAIGQPAGYQFPADGSQDHELGLWRYRQGVDQINVYQPNSLVNNKDSLCAGLK